MQLKQCSAAQRPRQTAFEGKRNGYMLIALCLPQDSSTTWEDLLSLWLLVEKDQEGSTSLLQLCRSLYSNFYCDLTPWRLQGNPGGPVTGNMTVDREEVDLQQPAHGSANAQVVIPTQQLCSSAEQSQGYTLNRKRWLHISDWFEFSNKEFCWP